MEMVLGVAIPEGLRNKFRVIEHSYSSRHSEYNFKESNSF